MLWPKSSLIYSYKIVLIKKRVPFGRNTIVFVLRIDGGVSHCIAVDVQFPPRDDRLWIAHRATTQTLLYGIRYVPRMCSEFWNWKKMKMNKLFYVTQIKKSHSWLRRGQIYVCFYEIPKIFGFHPNNMNRVRIRATSESQIELKKIIFVLKSVQFIGKKWTAVSHVTYFDTVCYHHICPNWIAWKKNKRVENMKVMGVVKKRNSQFQSFLKTFVFKSSWTHTKLNYQFFDSPIYLSVRYTCDEIFPFKTPEKDRAFPAILNFKEFHTSAQSSKIPLIFPQNLHLGQPISNLETIGSWAEYWKGSWIYCKTGRKRRFSPRCLPRWISWLPNWIWYSLILPWVFFTLDRTENWTLGLQYWV